MNHLMLACLLLIASLFIADRLKVAHVARHDRHRRGRARAKEQRLRERWQAQYGAAEPAIMERPNPSNRPEPQKAD